MNQDNSEMTVTYHGKALHQVGSASVHSYADNLHAGVTADYLYTGPIYVIGDVNNYYWNTSNGALMSRDGDGVYTVTVTAQQSSDAAYKASDLMWASNRTITKDVNDGKNNLKMNQEFLDMILN